MDNYFKVPFANAGDKTAIPEDTQANGSVSYTTGYGLDYQKQRGVDSGAKAIERDKMNSLLFKTTAAIQAMQTFGGASAFITSADNGGTAYSYSKGARVSLSGVVYESLTNANTTTPPGANWQIVNWADVVSFLDTRFVNIAGDTMTGPLTGKSGAPTVGNSNGAGFVFGAGNDTGVFSPSEGVLQLARAGVAKQRIDSAGTTFLGDAGQDIAAMGLKYLSINAQGSDARIYIGPTYYLTVSNDGNLMGLYNGSAWSPWFCSTAVAGASGKEAVNAEWIRRFISIPAAGVIDIGDTRIIRGAFVVGNVPAYPSEATGTVTFPVPFGSEPTVTFGAYNDARYAWLSIAGIPGTGGFNWRAQEPSGSAIDQNYIASYIAMGPKP